MLMFSRQVMDVIEKDIMDITGTDIMNMMGITDIRDLDARILAHIVKTVNSVDEKMRERLVLRMRGVTGFSKEKMEEAISAMSQALEEMYPDVFEEPPPS
jgi:hypothetical protein